MTTMLEDLTKALQGDALTSIAAAVGGDPASVGKGVAAAIPALITALARKADTPDGAANLFDALSKNFDGSMLDNLSNLAASPLAAHGLPFLQNILGDAQGTTENKIAKISGLDTGLIGRLLPILAPVVLSYVGRMIKTQNLDASSLAAFLRDQRGFVKASAPGLIGFLESIDANDDGSVLDDLSRLAGRLFGRA